MTAYCPKTCNPVKHYLHENVRAISHTGVEARIPGKKKPAEAGRGGATELPADYVFRHVARIGREARGCRTGA